MSTKFLNGIDLTQQELRNACLQVLASDPAFKEALIYYHSGQKVIKFGANGVYDYAVPASEKGAASGVATLNASSLVIQNPANAQETSGANKIPMAGAGGKLDAGWLPLGTGNGIDADKLDGQEGTYYLARANHTGTQTAATISDFDTQVRTSRLDQMAAPTASVSANSQKITNVGAPTLDTDAANKIYVDNAVQGIDGKASVRVATTANITLSAAQTIDGVAVVVGDRVLVKNQTTANQNGVYLVAAGAWTRATDADAWAELQSAYVFVEQGTTQADTGWTCTADAGGTLGTTSVSWVQFSAAGQISASNVNLAGQGVFKQKNGTTLEFRGINVLSSKISLALNATNNTLDIDVVEANLNLANLGGTLDVASGGTGGVTAAAAKTNLGFTTKYMSNIGDGSATSIVVTHNLGVDCCVEVYETASPYAKVYPDVLHTSATTVTLSFANAPTSGQYRVVVIG